MSINIQEYLIGLGFSVDQSGAQRFNVTIAAAAKQAQALSAVLVATGTQIASSMTQIAREFENLYYVSQRTGQTVEGLQAISFGAKQIGINADNAMGALERFTRAIKLQPGLEGVLQSFGVRNGEPNQRFKEFVRYLATVPDYLKSAYGELFGQSFPELQLLTSPGGLQRLSDEAADFTRRQREAGVDADKLAASSTAFGRSWNTLKSDVEIFGEKLLQNVLPVMERLVNLADRIVRAFNSDKGEKYSDPSNKLSRYMYTWGRQLGVVSQEDFDAEVKRQQGLAGDGPSDAAISANRSAAGAPRARGAGAGGVIDFFTRAGFSREAATGIAANVQHESNFQTDATGDNGSAYGLFQWRGDRRRRFQELYGKPIENSSFEEQMNYALWELTQGPEQTTGNLLRGPVGQSAGRSAAAFSTGFERPFATRMEETNRAASAERILLQQTNTINVSGGGSPDAIAGAVAGAQGRVNGDLVRNLSGAVR